jgi:hypothetical protein
MIIIVEYKGKKTFLCWGCLHVHSNKDDSTDKEKKWIIFVHILYKKTGKETASSVQIWFLTFFYFITVATADDDDDKNVADYIEYR